MPHVVPVARNYPVATEFSCALGSFSGTRLKLKNRVHWFTERTMTEFEGLE